MTEIGSLQVTIGINQTDFANGIRQAAERLDALESATDKAGRKIQDFGGKLQSVGGNLSKYVSAPLAAAGAAAFAFANRFAQAADATAKHADKIGVGTDALQELRFAAQESGVSTGVLDTALQRLARRTAEAAQGSGTLKGVLEQYGIAATNAEGQSRSAEEMLTEIAGAMQAAGTEGERLRIAIAAFDTEGAGMVNMLRDGSAGLGEMRDRAREMGAVISEDTLRQSEQFANNMLHLQTQLAAVGNTVAAALIPAFNELMPLIGERIVPAIQSMAEGVAGAIHWFSQLPAPVQEAAGVIAAVFGTAGPAVLAVGTFAKVLGGLVAAAGPVGLAIAAAAALYTAWQLWGDQITEIVTNTIGWLSETFTTFAEFAINIWSTLGESIVAAFTAPLDRIKQVVGDATGAIGDFFQSLGERLVWGSVIPDMFADIETEFGRLWNLVAETDAATGAMSDSWAKSASEQTSTIQKLSADSLGLLSRMFEGSKIIAIAQAIVNTWQGVSQTLATYPWPLAGALAAVHAAAGLATVASIKSTSSSSTSASGRGPQGGGTTSAASTPAPQQAQQQVIRLEGVAPGMRYSGEQIIELVNQAQRRGAVLEISR